MAQPPVAFAGILLDKRKPPTGQPAGLPLAARRIRSIHEKTWRDTIETINALGGQFNYIQLNRVLS